MNEIKISQKASTVGIIFGDKRSVNQLKDRLSGICIQRNLKKMKKKEESVRNNLTSLKKLKYKIVKYQITKTREEKKIKEIKT